jgi:mannitol operon repressor
MAKEEEADEEEFGRLLQAMDTDSDRATAVVAASLLDDTIRSLILSCAKTRVVAEKLLGTTAPLGTFSARIDAAHAFGFLTDAQATDLHILRRIRNEFAHRLRLLTFGSQKIADLTRNLKSTEEDPRRRFILVATSLSFEMELVMQDHLKLRIAQAEGLTADPQSDTT